MQKMKAAIRRKYGSPSAIQIEHIERPVPKENEILIKIHYATVNRTDCANLTAKPFIMRFVLGSFKPRKVILGTDFAGEVVSIGKQVSLFSVGDKVFGFNDTGAETHAEYVSVAQQNAYPIPDKIDFNTAAASLEGAHYAYTFIHKTNIKPDQSILVNGATGAIGSALLQFLGEYDVRLTATCNTKNIERINSLGAHKTYDYTTEDFTNDKDKYDFIFDAVGKSTFGKCKPLLKEKGIYSSSELGPYAQNIFYSIFSKKVIFPIPFHTDKTIPYISHLLEKGAFKPVLDREYPLDDIAKAYEYVSSGQKTGNVLIKMI